jgi:zinc/manganese transport system substrate-binding protein
MKKDIFIPLIIIAIFVILIVTGGLYLHSAKQKTTNNKIQVVAAENFWGNIISQIGGDKITVTSIITNPNTDPHLYESDANNALAVSKANLVIENGLGYDDFMDKLLSASPNSSRQVVSAATILGISGNDANPHLWYDTADIPKITAVFESELIKLDPADQKTFESNTQTFNQSLQPILDTINIVKTKYPNAPVAYTERVPGYLLLAAGLDVKTPVGFATAIEDGNDPSPADVLAMDNLMTNHQIKVLLYNAQVTSPTTEHVKELAVENNIPIVGVTETMPANEKSFQSWQLDQVQALLKALGN